MVGPLIGNKHDALLFDGRDDQHPITTLRALGNASQRYNRLMRVYALAADHPLVTSAERCPACRDLFVADDRIVLVPIGPGNDAAEQARARAGQPFIAMTVPAHATCAGVE